MSEFPEVWGTLQALYVDPAGAYEFPLRYMPPVLARYVEALSQTVQVPRDMVAACMLGILSAAGQGRFLVDCGNKWREQCVLFVVVSADPGERKSGCLSALLRPLLDYQRDWNEENADAIAASKAKANILKNRYDTLNKQYASGKKDIPIEDVLDARSELERYQVLKPLQLFTDDVTEEKLAILMRDQRENMAVISAEGGILDTMSGKYGRSSSFDLYLKGFSGDYVQIDRVMRESITLKKPRLTVCLMVQPVLLRKLCSDESFYRKGLSARFLYATPPSMVGHRAIYSEQMDMDVEEAYLDCMTRIVSAQFEEAQILRLDPDARELLDEFRRTYEPQLSRDGHYAHLSGWGSKLPGAVVRIAGLLHVANHAHEMENLWNIPIDRETMQAAVEIGGYFHHVANLLFCGDNMAPDLQLAAAIWDKYLKNRRGQSMKLTTLTFLMKNLPFVAKEREAALDALEERGYIQRSTEHSTDAGRPFTIIHIRPSE